MITGLSRDLRRDSNTILDLFCSWLHGGREMDELLSQLLNLGMVISAIFMLWKGADYFVDSAANIARSFNISELVIGLTLVGMGTSAPEFAVSVGAALSDKADISVSNIVGSNIFNLGFILGGCAAIRPMVASPKMVYRDGFFLIGISALLVFLIQDSVLDRFDGATMLGVFALYLLVLFKQRDAGDEACEEDEQTSETSTGWKDVLGLVGGLALIMVGSQFLVTGASDFARYMGMSEWAIGITIVAAGTSTPELVTCLSAVLKGRHGISAGALIGSDLYNILGVLGTAAVIRPLAVNEAGIGSVWLLLGGVSLVAICLRTGWRISRGEGIFLACIAGLRWWIDLAGISLF